VQAVNIITTADPLALLAIEAGQVQPPLSEGAAEGSSQLDTQQRSIVIGEPVPIVFCRRDETNGTGGVLISPGASECRFENDVTNNVTAYYHLVLSEGQIGSIQVRDMFQRSCRVGSFSQTYNRRAGTWTPGNVIVARAGYTMPEASYYCGTVGVYSDMSTLSFSVTIPNGFDQWNRQVHCFIRNGMIVTRLVDSVTGSSNNYADLVHWCLINSSKIPSTLVDTTALTRAANFLNINRFNCDVNLKESTNLPDLLARFSPYLLVTETRNLGKRGLRPLLPINNDYTINTGSINWEFTFTEEHVLPGSFEITYTPLADRKPFCAQMLWRQQLTDDFGIIRTAEVRYGQTALNGPFEQHDMSAFCTVENHAVKAGAYILARRKYITHTLRFSCRPGVFNTLLEPGDIVRVTLTRAASGTASVDHDFLYELNRVTKTLRGDLTLELTHFPVDSQGRSLVAVDVAAAVGSGVVLTSNKSGVGCDINSSTDTSVPAETFTNGTPLDFGSSLTGGIESPPGAAETNPPDPYEPQPFLSYNGTSSTGTDPIGQGTLIRPNAPCPGGGVAVSSWYVNGVLVSQIDVANSTVLYIDETKLNQPGTPQLQLSGSGGDPGSFVAFGSNGDEYLNVIECVDGTKSSSSATMGSGTVAGGGGGGVLTFESGFGVSCFYPLGSSNGQYTITSYGEPMWIGSYDPGTGTRIMLKRDSAGAIQSAFVLTPPLGPPPSLTTPNYCRFDGGTGGLPNEPWTATPIVTLKNAKLNGTVVIDYTTV
jgi:hypothetical protein